MFFGGGGCCGGKTAGNLEIIEEFEVKEDPIVAAIDVDAVRKEIDEKGYSMIQGLLSEEECLHMENGTFNHLTFKPFEDEGLRNFIGKDFGD